MLKDPEFTLKFHRGELFAGSEHEREAITLKSLQRAPIVVDASTDAVLSVLQQAES
jgi:hypothetical protein